MMMARLKQFYDSHVGLPLDPDAAQPGVTGQPIHNHPGFMAIVMLGGCFGTLARYGIDRILPTGQSGWPIATVSVNLIGAFILGALLQLLINHGPDSGTRRLVRLGAGTGFLGAFTTYSTFATDTHSLIQHAHADMAIAYIAVSLAGGVTLSALGIYLAAKHHRYFCQDAS